jgi:DNA ligase (NAD+)
MTPAELKALVKNRFDVKFTYGNIKTILLNASKSFYNKTSKLLTDDEYDALRDFYEAEKGKLPVGAPVTVGATLELSHSYSDFAGTLSKCKNFKDVEEWARLKKITDDVFVCSIKGDGHSITVEIAINDDDEPRIDKVLTRGEDGVGKDLTAIFRANRKHFPIPQIPWNCAIGYEAIITYEDFEKLSEVTKGKYKNPRSAIGGILSNSGQQYFNFVTFVPIRIKSQDADITRAEQFEFLTDLPNFELFQFQTCYLNQIEEIYDEHQDARTSSKGAVNFMYDGLVIETFSEASRNRLGYSTTEPNFATALKFAPSEKATKAKDVKWSAEGFTGRFTPVIHFTPVVINGNTYKQVSLANLARFEALDLHVDDDISFTLRHDTLGYVDKLDTSKNTGKTFAIPTHCPECQEALERDETFLFCANPICKLNVVGSVYNFIVKTGVMNIGRETIKLLVDEGYITGIPSLFTMNFKQLHAAKIAGLGKVSIDNIKKELEKIFSKPVKDYIFLGSLNIPQVSRERSKLILQDVKLDTIIATAVVHFDKPKEMVKLITGTHGIGKEIANNLTKYCFEMQWVISEILNHITIEASEKVEVAEDFVQLSFCHTGNAAPLKDRAAIKVLIENKGHKFATSVTGKTNYLINNDETSTTDKNATANKLKIPIISVQAMIDMMQ